MWACTEEDGVTLTHGAFPVFQGPRPGRGHPLWGCFLSVWPRLSFVSWVLGLKLGWSGQVGSAQGPCTAPQALLSLHSVYLQLHGGCPHLWLPGRPLQQESDPQLRHFLLVGSHVLQLLHPPAGEACPDFLPSNPAYPTCSSSGQPV